MKKLLFAAGMALAATSVQAEGWLVRDFGTAPDRDRCMSDAVAMFDSYVAAHGGEPGKADWIAVGYDLVRSGDDAVVICPYVADTDVIHAFLVIHGDDSDSRTKVADRLEALWDNQN